MEKETVDPMQYLYIRSAHCPCCDRDFRDIAVRRSKLRVRDIETDNKTNFHELNANLYEVMFCTNCGYAALRSGFDRISSKQQDIITAKISRGFKYVEHDVPFDPKTALERYHQALRCVEAIGGKASQKAFLQLRMAWILRDAGKTAEELQLVKAAHANLKTAFTSENFPIGNMDELNAKYLIAELARRMGEYREALRWISDVIVAKGVTSGLKERALNVKELIRERALAAQPVTNVTG